MESNSITVTKKSVRTFLNGLFLSSFIFRNEYFLHEGINDGALAHHLYHFNYIPFSYEIIALIINFEMVKRFIRILI